MPARKVAVRTAESRGHGEIELHQRATALLARRTDTGPGLQADHRLEPNLPTIPKKSGGHV